MPISHASVILVSLLVVDVARNLNSEVFMMLVNPGSSRYNLQVHPSIDLRLSHRSHQEHLLVECKGLSSSSLPSE